jgi:rod shape-determining protein MreD
MSVILSIPVLGFLSVFQSAVISRLPLNRGTADLMLVLLVAVSLQKQVRSAWQWTVVGGLFMDFISGLPFGLFTASYLLSTGMALAIRERIWRFSFLMQLLVVLIGTAVTHLLSYLVLFLQGASLPLLTVLRVVTLPSLVLNFMLSLPVYILTQDLVEQFYPPE